MHSPGAALRLLLRDLDELRSVFLEPYITPALQPPSRKQIWDVRAYIVLAHAEFEQFFEDAASWLLDNAERSWLRKRVVSSALLCAGLRTKPGLAVDKETIYFEAVRGAVTQAKETLGRDIRLENHGIAAKHLKKMYWSLGVELPDDASGMGSVERLSGWRGAQAHHAIGAETVPAAPDILATIAECVKVATAVRRKCVAALGSKR